MNNKTFDAIASRIATDADFRQQMAANPDAAAADMGISLTAEDKGALRRSGLVPSRATTMKALGVAAVLVGASSLTACGAKALHGTC